MLPSVFVLPTTYKTRAETIQEFTCNCSNQSWLLTGRSSARITREIGTDWHISLLTGEIRYGYETNPALYFQPNDPLYLWIVTNGPTRDELSTEICRRLREGGFGFIADNWPQSPNLWCFLREALQAQVEHERVQAKAEEYYDIRQQTVQVWGILMHPKDEDEIVGDLRALMGSDGAVGNTAKKVCAVLKPLFAALDVDVNKR